MQGKCPHCAIRFLWDGAPKVKHALCPRCDTPLQRTSHESKLPTREEQPTEGTS